MINTERPLYRVLDPAGFYGDDDTLYPEGSEIYFEGEPNEQMEPLNDSAKDKLVTYIEKLDNLARIAAEKAGRPFVGRPRTLDGALAIATQDMRNSMSIMGTKNKVSTIEAVTPAETPETGSANPKKRGRPLGSKNKIKTETLQSLSH